MTPVLYADKITNNLYKNKMFYFCLLVFLFSMNLKNSEVMQTSVCFPVTAYARYLYYSILPQQKVKKNVSEYIKWYI